MKRGIKVVQFDGSDCGAACIASIAAYYGIKLSIADIRIHSNTDTQGTTIKGLVDAASKYGFKAAAMKGERENIFYLPTPSILHLQFEDGRLHYVVLYGVNGAHAKIMDPALGEITKLSIKELSNLWSGYVVIMEPSHLFDTKPKGVSTFEQLLSLMVSHRRQLFLAALFSIIYIGLSALASLFVKIIIDSAIPNRDQTMILIIASIMFITLIIKGFMIYLRTNISLVSGISMDRTLIISYISQLTTLPVNFYLTRKSGEISSRISDAVKVRSMLNDLTISLLLAFLSLLIAMAAVAIVSPAAALLVGLFIPLFVLIYWVTDNVSKRPLRQLAEEGARFESHIIEGIKNMNVIKHYCQQSTFIMESAKIIRKINEKMGKSVLISAFSAISSEFITGILTLMVMCGGALLVIDGEITQGEMIAIMTLISFFVSPLNSLTSSAKEIREGLISAERLFEIDNLDCEDITKGVDKDFEDFMYLSFENVEFSYPGHPTIFKNLNFKIKANQITVIMGKSGSGKSTIASLLMRDLKPTKGSINIDFTNIENMNLIRWRHQIGCVTQEPSLFSGSIIDNITNRDFVDKIDDIEMIINFLNLQDIYTKRPNGYLDLLGENGKSLSRGQQQRVAIARLMYHYPSIMIFDEPTASIDQESSELIISRLKSLKEMGKTVILITHNPAHKSIADTVIDLDVLRSLGD